MLNKTMQAETSQPRKSSLPDDVLQNIILNQNSGFLSPGPSLYDYDKDNSIERSLHGDSIMPRSQSKANNSLGSEVDNLNNSSVFD